MRELIDAQLPHLAGLPVQPLPGGGTSHAVFRLGEHLVVRLPRVAWAEQQVEREARWLPRLGPLLPASVEVPQPVAAGKPQGDYPFRWLVSAWVAGTDLLGGGPSVGDPTQLARDLAAAILALQAVGIDEAPLAGKRGQALALHDATVRADLASIARAGEHPIDTDAALRTWEQALAADPHRGAAVWVHGDLLPGNVVIRDGRLAGLIDWSAAGAGDPACDLMIAWDLPPDARVAYLDALEVDEPTIARARGWVVEQAAAFIPYYARTLPAVVAATEARLAAALEG